MKPAPGSHTPGPWIANDCVVKAGDCYGPWIADTDLLLRYPPRKPHIGHAEQRANARLIAAAPDLLKVAKFFATYERIMETMVTPQDAAMVRAAIAKAKGER